MLIKQPDPVNKGIFQQDLYRLIQSNIPYYERPWWSLRLSGSLFSGSFSNGNHHPANQSYQYQQHAASDADPFNEVDYDRKKRQPGNLLRIGGQEGGYAQVFEYIKQQGGEGQQVKFLQTAFQRKNPPEKKGDGQSEEYGIDDGVGNVSGKGKDPVNAASLDPVGFDYAKKGCGR